MLLAVSLSVVSSGCTVGLRAPWKMGEPLIAAVSSYNDPVLANTHISLVSSDLWLRNLKSGFRIPIRALGEAKAYRSNNCTGWTEIELTYDRGSNPGGWYRLEGTMRIQGHHQIVDTAAQTVTLGDKRGEATANANGRIYVAPPPLPRPGPQYLVLPNDGEPSVPAPALSRLVGDPSDNKTLLSDSGKRVRLAATSSIADATWLKPIAEDEEVRAVRKKWLGKRVWGVGSIPVERFRPGNVDETELPFDANVRVIGVYRLAVGNAMTYLAGPSGPDFATANCVDPLIFVYEGARKGKTTERFAWTFSGPWQVDRTLSLQGPRALHRDWSEPIQRAIARRETLKGMTPDQVAWIWGWPYSALSPAEGRRMTEWSFGTTDFFSSRIIFRNGKVVGFDPPPTLP